MLRRLALLALLPLLAAPLRAQPQIERVEPAFWWTGMAHGELQILVYGDGIGHARAALAPHDGVTLRRAVQVESPNYLFLELHLAPDAEPGALAFTFTGPDGTANLDYDLRARTRERGTFAQGFSSEDVIYLMMPDRFANGDPSNDAVPGMLEGVDRTNADARQGGDFAGVRQHLDYIADLGMTAIWFTPVFENDVTPEYGAYHGYAATDMYRVDRRFGTNDEFAALVDAVHARGMKVIMDMIHNHVGDRHWWMADPPAPDWFHSLEAGGITNYRTSAAVDPYASEYDRHKLTDGWFVREMPDLDQDNDLLTRYLLQNTIWWIERSGIDGIRMDTYPYPDPDYMARWAAHVVEEYPRFEIVGEAWMHRVSHTAHWQSGSPVSRGYDSNLRAVTDFTMQGGILGAFDHPEGWDTGLAGLYFTLAQDGLYADPSALVAFLDNHDTPRAFSILDDDEAALRMAYAVLMTLPRSPQVYYGTELAMPNGPPSRGDGYKRTPMTGGWPGDERSVFDPADRTPREARMHRHVRALTRWRRTSRAVHHGRTTQFLPQNETYVYFRWTGDGTDDGTGDETVMVVVNKADEPRTLDLARFAERLKNASSGRDVVSGTVHDLGEPLVVEPRTALVLEVAR